MLPQSMRCFQIVSKLYILFVSTFT